VNWLGGGKFAATAIDAPFSIPATGYCFGAQDLLDRNC